MDNLLLYPLGCSDSCGYAAAYLHQLGFPLTDHPTPEVTHLLLDVPSLDPSGFLKDGRDLKEVLRMLPNTVTVLGGTLNPNYLQDYRIVDLMQDPHYLAKNAAITAECALRVAVPYLKSTFADSPALILGWGRIGKCLAKLLSSIGCPVSVAARNESDRAMLTALGYRAVDYSQIPQNLPSYAILFNTVPDLSLPDEGFDFEKMIIAIDLASYPGLPGRGIITARGLPGKFTPESSGRLIADTIYRMYREGVL